MGFFGMLLAVVCVSTIALFAKEAAMLNGLSAMAYAENAYANMQSINAFHAIIEDTMPSNATQYGNWINALKACAIENNINIYITSNTIVISNINAPYFREAVYLA
ncbi:MAG: hypothetical protein M1360_04375 [Candidatus Marsarchaeota archaeon]|jgi:hypothetical protein|nr:hypothetical protein [Candidatus Marsarchaeota archaeon]MCL5419142.1 hypothetical protein [Candidatus Marsarchaeota archaeon]